jgi:uncharacterized protein (TIGR03435 family)
MQSTKTRSRVVLALAVMALFEVPHLLYAQSASTPAFTAASIKRNDAVSANSSTSFFPGGRFSSRFNPLSRLIITAYRIKDYQLSGGPGWIYSERYDIDATAENNATRDEMRLMVQNLLAERFRLKIQRGKKDLPVYAVMSGNSIYVRNGSADSPAYMGSLRDTLRRCRRL